MTWHPDPITGEPIMHLGKGYGDIHVSDLDDEWWSDEDEVLDSGHAETPPEQGENGSYETPENTP